MFLLILVLRMPASFPCRSPFSAKMFLFRWRFTLATVNIDYSPIEVSWLDWEGRVLAFISGIAISDTLRYASGAAATISPFSSPTPTAYDISISRISQKLLIHTEFTFSSYGIKQKQITDLIFIIFSFAYIEFGLASAALFLHASL